VYCQAASHFQTVLAQVRFAQVTCSTHMLHHLSLLVRRSDTTFIYMVDRASCTSIVLVLGLQAKQTGYGAVYLTDHGCNGWNPWDQLPSYWVNETRTVRQ